MIVFEIIFGIIIVGLCAIFAGLARKHRNEAGQFCKQAHEWAAAAQAALETARSSNKATDDLVTKSLVSMKVLLDRSAEHEAKAKFHEIQAGNRAAAAKVEADQAFKHALLAQKLSDIAEGYKISAENARDASADHADYANCQVIKSTERAEAANDAVIAARKSVVEAQNHASVAIKHTEAAAVSEIESREHMLAAHKSAQASQTQANIALGHSTISQSAAIDALKHKKDAAEHVAVATRVSVMVRDLAERANVRLVPPGKKYTSTEGSNIHRG